jgi:molecular chaperone DnaK
MKKAIGIDLGTTNSVVAFKDTLVKIIRNRENDELTRSCVGLRKGEIVVGSIVYTDIKRDPINTILSVKRLMGGAISDNMVQEMIQSPYYKFGITQLQGGTEDSVAVILGGKQYTAEQISAEILKKLKVDAEDRLGGEVSHAVITVPAYFTEKQKNATRIAAQIAGLKVQKLLAEPTAAAISYGVDNLKVGESKTVLIYDFGGGTFDLSILNIVDGQYIEAGTGGDRWLGGDDIDMKLQEFILEKVSKIYNIDNIKQLIKNLSDKKRILFEGEIRLQTEAAKIQLSSANSAQIIIDNLLEDESEDVIDINISITREEFEKLVKPFVEKTIDLISDLLNDVGYEIDMIDNILLVGGTSCIPLVRHMLSDKFGFDKIKFSEKPMLVVAEGAAILSHRLGDEFEFLDQDLTTTIGDISCSTNHNYYIQIADGDSLKMEKVIEKQTPLPIQVSRNFKTTSNNQKVVKVSIFSDVEYGKNELQALGFYLIEENLPIGSELVFDFDIDTNENLNVSVSPKGNENLKKKIVLGRGNADQKALQSIDELIFRSTKEYKTIDGEQAFLKYISQRIKEIEKIGISTIEDNKWHEIFYTTTEKYEEIINSEEQSSDVENIVWRAKRLLIEFADLLETFDKNTMLNLISQIESSVDEIEKMKLADTLENKTDEYGMLNAALRIENFANRILNIPVTLIGGTKRQDDVSKLKQLSIDIKTKFKMNEIESAKLLLDDAYSIIGNYRQFL